MVQKYTGPSIPSVKERNAFEQHLKDEEKKKKTSDDARSKEFNQMRARHPGKPYSDYLA